MKSSHECYELQELALTTRTNLGFSPYKRGIESNPEFIQGLGMYFFSICFKNGCSHMQIRDDIVVCVFLKQLFIFLSKL